MGTGQDGYIRATESDIRSAFRLFFHREADPEGMEHYAGLLDQGLLIHDLAERFCRSHEFRSEFRNEVLSKVRGAVVEPNPGPITVDLGGYVVVVDPREIGMAKALVEMKDYEPHVRKAIVARLHPGETFIDVGGNIGCITFLASKVVGPTGTVVAVEPNHSNVQRLYAGIALNGAANVRVLPFAASDRREIFSLGGGPSNSFLTPGKSGDVFGPYAESVVLDDELSGLPRVDFVKIDIEGHEPFAIRGLDRLLRKHRPTLITEFHPYALRDIHQIEPTAYLDQLFSYYPSLRVIEEDGDSVAYNKPEAIIDHWKVRGRAMAEAGIVESHLAHLDLVAERF